VSSVEIPKIIEGGLSTDDRGSVAYANDFSFEGVKRFYILSNHQNGFVRAWHAHRNEAKYFLPVQGTALVGAVAINNWEAPDSKADVHRFVLSAQNPTVLYIPSGYANGSMSLSSDMKLLVFSTSTLEESMNDDVRFDARYWNIWSIVER
jgi:dTDP-4-dehydrorhamnose 3,5-epimerase-like enzyme